MSHSIDQEGHTLTILTPPSDSGARQQRDLMTSEVGSLAGDLPPLDAVEDRRPTRTYQALLLLSGFMMTFQTIGINQCYGIFQEFYTSPESNIPSGPGQEALIALVGTIGSGLTWSGSIFVSPMISISPNLKMITLTGVLIMSLGIIMASFASELWHLFLTQSLLYGVGSSLLYYPIMSLTPPFFDRHRGFAMGTVLAGSGIGGLVLAPVLHQLLERVGIRQTLRILGLWNLLVGVPVACVVRKPPGFSRRGQAARVNIALARRGTFMLQALAAFLQAAGNVIPLYYLTTYSTSVLSYSSSTGSILLAANNAVNSTSRIAMGVLADYVGRQNTMIASVILSGISVFALWTDASRARFLAFVILYGIYSGGYNALLPTTITEIYGVQNYAPVNAAIYFIRGLGALFGAPIAGIILGTYRRGNISTGSTTALSELRDKYDDVASYSGALLLGAGVCVVYVRWLDSKAKGAWAWKA
ncbi:MFS general substrate transporter [Artomyces pyxidatus]|uniref:MFS general substrate transporter n=1 Tax=Artomyces pyxidatus TaxID=48021 RepID=A0ACB8TCL9_9AGAM|nr:MFS general substrate transporter [Artomyces pyxidatus]